MARWEELLTGYGRVDMLWFDHVAGNWRDYDFQSLYNTLYQLQPGILVNDRAARFIRPTEDKPSPEMEALTRGDFDTPEQKVGRLSVYPSLGIVYHHQRVQGRWRLVLAPRRAYPFGERMHPNARQLCVRRRQSPA